MLHILFFVLKWIGIILLAILGILVLSLCSALFIPARYQIQASTEGGIRNLSFEAKVHWFLHLFSAFYVYKDRKSDFRIQIAFWKLGYKKQKTKKEKDEEVKETPPDEDEEKSSTEQKKKPGFLEKIKCTTLKFCDRIKALWETKEKVAEYFTDDVHVEAFKIVKSEIAILARHLRPRRIRGFVRFGFEDPYETGQVLAVLSVLYPFYGDNVDIEPDFEHKVLEGELHIKGHIRLLHLVVLIWRLFFNHNVRKTYKDYKILKS